MSCGVGCSSDSMLLWLWRRLVATALIRPLAWEPPYAMGTGLKKAKRQKIKNKKPIGSHLSKLKKKKNLVRNPIVVQQVKNPTSIHEEEGSIPGLTQ